MARVPFCSFRKEWKNRAQFLIKQLIEHSYKEGSDLILSRNTPYINTIKPEEDKKISRRSKFREENKISN